MIEATIVGTELELYHDHAQVLAARHLAPIRGQDSCYVMYREFRYKGVPVFAIVLQGQQS